MCPNAPTVSLLLTVGAVRTAAEMSPAPAVPAVSTVQTENVKYHTASLTVRLKRRPKRWCKKAFNGFHKKIKVVLIHTKRIYYVSEKYINSSLPGNG